MKHLFEARALSQLPEDVIRVQNRYSLYQIIEGRQTIIVGDGLAPNELTLDSITVDLYGSRTFFENFDEGRGVTNMFDKTYTNHLNKSNSFDATEAQVNEPGRSFCVRATGTF